MTTEQTRMSEVSIYRFRLLNMSCASCVRTIEQGIKNLSQVQNFQINFADRTLSIKTSLSPEQIIRAIEKTGYSAEWISETNQQTTAHLHHHHPEESKSLLVKTIIAVLWGLIIVGFNLIQKHWPTPFLLKPIFLISIGISTLIVMLYSGGHIYQRAMKQLFHAHVTMDTLITVGTVAAWIYSMLMILMPHQLPLAKSIYFETAVIILAFVNFGALLETRSRRRTQEAIKKLLGLQPKTARVIRNNQTLDIPIENIQIDEVIQIRPGETIPVDGEVIEGESYVDESMLTGESMPVLKKFGGTVFAGTLNKLGSFLFRAKKIGKDTVLAQIIQLVEQAQQTRPSIARLADKIASIFVPIVIVIAVITAVIWYFSAPVPIRIDFMWVTSIAILVIACPCALGLATPISAVVGLGKAAQNGILIRNGEALQRASRLTTLVLDKTGTITKGQPEVTLLHPWKNITEEKLLLWAASLELYSEHPIGEALIAAAKKKEIQLLPVEQFQAIVGQGVKGNIQEHEILLGNVMLMKNYKVNADTFAILAEELSWQAQTPLFLAVDRKIAGLIAISDPVKSDSKLAIDRIKKYKIKVVMLTGDNEMIADKVAGQVGIKEVMANVSPQEKYKEIEKLQKCGEFVGMVGDGINDAPALSQSDVGFSIGAGTDVAVAASDVTLMQNSLAQVVDAIVISKKIMRNIKQNLFFAFAYNICAIPIAAGALYPFFKLLLNPMIAAAAMAASSITVVLNASRLRAVKIRK